MSKDLQAYFTDDKGRIVNRLELYQPPADVIDRIMETYNPITNEGDFILYFLFPYAKWCTGGKTVEEVKEALQKEYEQDKAYYDKLVERNDCWLHMYDKPELGEVYMVFGMPCTEVIFDHIQELHREYLLWKDYPLTIATF